MRGVKGGIHARPLNRLTPFSQPLVACSEIRPAFLARISIECMYMYIVNIGIEIPAKRSMAM
jgi:hypothetical protein